MTTFHTIRVERGELYTTVTLDRPAARNSINFELLAEINSALDTLEADPRSRVIVIQGAPDVFCAGMDFQEAAARLEAAIAADGEASHALYLRTLKRLTLFPRPIVCRVQGAVLAGGVGLAAACDLVIAAESATFALSEALWGLLPASVAPFLIRRVGFQKAYALTLTTQSISARRAYEIGLVDELGTNLDDSIRRVAIRLAKLDEATVREMKQYFRSMWIVSDAMEAAAVAETAKLMADPRVRHNIKMFVDERRLPWEHQ